MKRNILWELYVRDVYKDESVCARDIQEDEDLGDFLEQFVNMTDFGFDCYIECKVYYTKEDKDE